jgi:hypothetical protein
MVIKKVEPTNPPAAACPVKALLTIKAKAAGISA